ncbi:uncharacterized protein LOC132298623 [Cornus florida]|uniref:uncharacterized protein LOC132298623 n=1 Tax=Cornus florida TaxID=4283 RepID=UPI00289C7166|nr:uncharacterized protein LOC132298623 [Cornus florida]
MKPANISLKLLIISLSLFLFFSFHVTTGATNQIRASCDICARQYYDSDPNPMLNFCINSFQAARGADRAGRRELAKIAMKLLKNNVTETQSFIKKTLKEKNLDPITKSSLNNCLGEYGFRAKASIDKGLRAYKNGQYQEAGTDMNELRFVAKSCDEGFKDNKFFYSGIAKRNDDLLLLASLALCLLDKIS